MKFLNVCSFQSIHSLICLTVCFVQNNMSCSCLSFTALFTNMWILKFKSQLTIALFAAINQLNRPFRKQNFTLTGSKRLWFLICDWWISIRFVCFCISRFVACDLNYDWRQRKTQLWSRLLNFRVRMFVKNAVIHCDTTMNTMLKK